MYASNLRIEYMETPLGVDVRVPRLSWVLESDERCQEQTAYQILVSTSEELLQADIGDMWDTGKVNSDQSIHIEYGGKELESRKRYFWKVRVWDKNDSVSEFSAPSWWEMGLLDKSDWCAHWVSMDRTLRGISDEDCIKPAPMLRKEFTVTRKVKRARIYVTALGLYEVFISRSRVGNDVLSPGWTDYNKRLYYQTYDVTDLLEQGKNAIGVILGEGWYSGSVAHVGPYQYGDNPALLLQLEIEYEDNTVDYIVTDESWKCSTGPILYSDILNGEIYDARKEVSGWSSPNFDDAGWTFVDVVDGVFKGALMAQVGPTVQVTKELKPIGISRTSSGAYIVDMGQNMVGWIRLKMVGDQGTKVTMRFAEMLDSDGNIYTENLRSAKQTDMYIMKGEGVETFEPRFTFHGFRYVEITGYPGELTIEDITGCVVHSVTPEAGAFQCSSSLVNQLQKNITWGQRGNFLSIPTDCPQRNERMGWTGDAQIFVRTACWNMDVAGFFTKWMADVGDAQFESGAFTDVAPQVKGMGGGNAAWGDAGVIVPWTIYKVYGDTRIIETHYHAMTRWIDYLKKNSTGLLRPEHGYGDWLSIDADTPKDVLGTAYFAYSTKLLSEMARVIGREEDAAEYERLFQDIKSAFINAYITPDGRIKGDTQTCYVLALHMDLVPEDMREICAKHLVENIKERNWHLSTGFLGVGYLLPVLTEAGYTDVAYRLLTNDTFPSWGYSIKHGATTIWERWDGWTEDKGFQDPGMNSFNHYSLGSVGQWLYAYAAGINPTAPAYKRITIHPRPGGGFTYAEARYQSVHGLVSSRWQIEENVFRLKVTIPINTKATVYLPTDELEKVTESGKGIGKAEGVSFIGIEDGCSVFAVGSGEYEFEVLR